MSIFSNINTRSDITAVGEILQLINNNQEGDLFMIGRIFNGKLYMLLRCISPIYDIGSTNNGNRGIITQINEYAWNEIGITSYVDDLNNVGFQDPNVNNDKKYWVADYFKWEITTGPNASGGPGDTAIKFGIYDKNGVKKVITDFTSPTQSNFIYPILKFEILLRTFNRCAQIGCNNGVNITSQYFFQPIFSVEEGDPSYTFTFLNTDIYYPEQINYQNDPRPTYYGFFQTDMPPGITKNIDNTTKLWTGVEYDANILATVYTNTKENNSNQESTRVFAREMYYYAGSNLVNTGINTSYDGLPTEFYIKNPGQSNNNDDSTSLQFYYFQGYSINCNNSCDLKTLTGDYYKGFKFMMLPVNTFNNDGISCNNQGLFNPVYYQCSTAVNKATTSDSYYINYCGNKIITGYSSLNDCILNKNSYPYYYPRFCFSDTYGNGDIVNENCGGNYKNQYPAAGDYITCASKPIITNLNDLFGVPFGGKSVV